jgi:hypothetical protein
MHELICNVRPFECLKVTGSMTVHSAHQCRRKDAPSGQALQSPQLQSSEAEYTHTANQQTPENYKTVKVINAPIRLQ